MRSGAPGGLLGRALTCVLAIAGAVALTGSARAAAVDIIDNLRLDGMSTGPCAGTICDTPFGTVTVTGDTTTSLTYTVTLASGAAGAVSFQAGATSDIFYFDLTGGNPSFSAITPAGGTNFTYGGPVLGTYNDLSGDFPGPYNYAVTCTQSAPATLCGTGFSFTVSGGSALDPFVIGSPVAGTGDFAGLVIPFVADLSVTGGTLCPGDTACTGLVGAPEPSTWGMMLIAFAGLGFVGYRRARGSQRLSAI
jgi:hypothetical protein